MSSQNNPDSRFTPGAVLPADVVDSYIGLEAQRAQLEADRAKLLANAEDILQMAETKGYAEGITRVAAKVIDFAGEMEAICHERLNKMEPELITLVSDALEEILCSADQAELASRIVRAKLASLRRFAPLTFSVSLGYGPAIKQAIDDQIDGLDVTIVEDDSLKNGRILVETPEGYFDLGIAEQGVIAKRLMAKRISALLRAQT